MNIPKNKSLVGRQVYFKMNKKKAAELDLIVKPNKLYTIRAHEVGAGIAEIQYDDKYTILILLYPFSNLTPKCTVLEKQTAWILKKEKTTGEKR